MLRHGEVGMHITNLRHAKGSFKMLFLEWTLKPSIAKK